MEKKISIPLKRSFSNILDDVTELRIFLIIIRRVVWTQSSAHVAVHTKPSNGLSNVNMETISDAFLDDTRYWRTGKLQLKYLVEKKKMFYLSS